MRASTAGIDAAMRELDHRATDRARCIDVLVQDVEVVHARQDRELGCEAVLPEVLGVELALADPLLGSSPPTNSWTGQRTLGASRSIVAPRDLRSGRSRR